MPLLAANGWGVGGRVMPENSWSSWQEAVKRLLEVLGNQRVHQMTEGSNVGGGGGADGARDKKRVMRGRRRRRGRRRWYRRRGYRLFFTNVKETFFGMSESGEASKGRSNSSRVPYDLTTKPKRRRRRRRRRRNRLSGREIARESQSVREREIARERGWEM
jgi:hypothetical protein